MKKLLFLLAGLAIMTACNQTKPDPNPGPTPTPGGDPMINRTEAKIKTLDTVHIFIANAPGKYEWTTTDMYMLQPLNDEFIQFQAFAFGEVTLSTEIDGKTYSCKITIDKYVDDAPRYDMPIVKWGATKAEVMAEAAKTCTFVKEETKEGLVLVSYTKNAPTIAPKGQEISYVFENDLLIELMTIAKYNDEEQAAFAWLYTLERSLYLGQDKDKYDHGVDRATESIYQQFASAKLKDGTDVFVSYMSEPQKSESIGSKYDTNRAPKSRFAEQYDLKQIAGPLTGIRTL